LLESTRLLTVVTILSAGFALPARAEYQLLDSTDLSEANAEDSMSLLSLLTETKKKPKRVPFRKRSEHHSGKAAKWTQIAASFRPVRKPPMVDNVSLCIQRKFEKSSNIAV